MAVTRSAKAAASNVISSVEVKVTNAVPTTSTAKRFRKRVAEGEEPEYDTLAVASHLQYKDDLPSAFNGAVHPDQDYISRMPDEILQHLASYLIMDHEPERAVYSKSHPGQPMRPHAILSLAAMSRPLYHAIEGYSRRFLHSHRDKMHWGTTKQPPQDLRRSPRLLKVAAAVPTIDTRVYRSELLMQMRFRCIICFETTFTTAIFSNMNVACKKCARECLGQTDLLTLTEARNYRDLRDYELLKNRKPGPKGRPINHLPEVVYGTQTKGLGFPAFMSVTSYFFRREDVDMLGRLVHGDVEKHMEEKRMQRSERALKLRRERIRVSMTKHHEDLLETSTGAVAKHHRRRIRYFKSPGWTEDWDFSWDVDNNRAICIRCGDVRQRPGLNDTACMDCRKEWDEKRLNKFYN